MRRALIGVTVALAGALLLALAGPAGAGAAGPRPASEAPMITITGFSPTSGIVGTEVTITGTGLDVIDNVGFAGSWARFRHVSPTQVVATVPETVTGTISVVAMGYAPAVSATSSGVFTFTPPPRIDLNEPSSGPGGTVVSMRGAFLLAATSVTFGGVSVGFVTMPDPLQPSYSHVVAQIPAGATSGSFVVVTPGGTATSPLFSVVPSPRITAVTPGSAKVGATVVVTGTNLDGATQVTLFGLPVGFTSATGAGGATELRLTLPDWAKTGSIDVVTPGGRATWPTFTVLVDPPPEPEQPAGTAGQQPAAASRPAAAAAAAKAAAPAKAPAAARTAPGSAAPALTAVVRQRRDTSGAVVRLDIDLAARRAAAGSEVVVQAYGRQVAGKPLRWTTVGTVILGKGGTATLAVRTKAGIALLKAGAAVRLVDADSLALLAGGKIALRA